MTAVTRPTAGAPAKGAAAGSGGVQRKPGTPRPVRRLRRLRLAAVSLVLAFGTLVVTALVMVLVATGGARESLVQYERLAQARENALKVQQAANLWALKPSAEVRAQVNERLGVVASNLADAAGVADDRARIVPLTGALVAYGMTLQDALNASGSASAAILVKADDQLQTELLTPLEAATATAADRLTADLTTNWLWWVIFGVVVAGGALVMILVALARTSHRYLNLGVAGGLVCAIVAATAMGLAAGTASNAGTEFSTTDRAQIDAMSSARQKLHQARADELLVVALRGTGTAPRERWTTNTTAARRDLSAVPDAATAASNLTTYVNAQSQVTAALTRSDWAAATALVTDGASAKAFTTLSGTITTLNANLRSPMRGSVTAAESATAIAIAAVLALSFGGAALAAWGVSQRIEEYR